MIDFNKGPGQKVLELGCGENPHPQSDCRVDVRQTSCTNFTADFEQPLPIASDEWDCVYGAFMLEHVTYRKVPQLLREVLRVLKPGGKAVFLTSNTEAQVDWARKHPEGWDGRDFFDSVSGLLFGDCDYPENSHKAYFTPAVLTQLFRQAGFASVVTAPAGARNTDLFVEASKAPAPPTAVRLAAAAPESTAPRGASSNELPLPAEQCFDKHYFNGGGKVGGYADEGYRDFPVHEVTARHVLARKPQSVLELGAARAHVGKRIEDAGVAYQGLEISKHCYLTRACDNLIQWDVTASSDWPVRRHDLCVSVAFLEHVPERLLPGLIHNMVKYADRGLHGVDFGERDDGFDRTHCLLRDKAWWQAAFAEHAPGWPVELVDKEELEKGEFPAEVLQGDGLTKVNVGSCTVMFHHGWDNLDVLDLAGFAKANGYRYRRHDALQGLPYGTSSVNLLYSSHLLEHFSYEQGLAFLREIKRVLAKDGLARIAVPDAELLAHLYANDPSKLFDFDEINDDCEKAPTAAGKFWALLHSGHQSAYDHATLARLAREAGLTCHRSHFREASDLRGAAQMRKEVTESFPDLSLFAWLTH